MKITFQVFNIVPSGVPVSVDKSTRLEDAVTAAFVLAIHEPGSYPVCFAQNSRELSWKRSTLAVIF
jgi:hypothetical protein